MDHRLFKVISSNQTADASGFITKLQYKSEKSIDTGFGIKTSDTQETYYIKLDEQAEIGLEKPLDLEKFDVVGRPFITDEGEELTLKWLFLK